MRLTELVGKEIVNMFNGARLGVIGESDMTIDVDSGHVHSIILPRRSNIVNMWMERQELTIPWEAVRKIGAEVVIVELENNQALPRLNRSL
ncbi:MAG: YlmC/YmxH family sporulation protein [Candidatus Desulforudis sp.]|nr:YlmC/YmxH family sporulation protein [Desulforudis sp.]